MNRFEAIRLILYVVAPEYFHKNENIETKRGEMDYVIRLAARNGLLYYFLMKSKEIGLYVEFYKEYWPKVQGQSLKFKNTIDILNRLSNDINMEYILIKRPDTIPHVPRDIDIFIHKQDEDRLKKAFEDRGIKKYIEIAGADLLSDLLPVDIYSEIEYFRCVGIRQDLIWASKEINEAFGVRFPSLDGEMNFLVTLLHSFIGHRRITLLDFLHLIKLRKNVNMKICEEYAGKDSWRKTFDLLLGKIDEIHENLLKGVKVEFPYLPDTKFIMALFSSAKGVKLTKKQEFILLVLMYCDKMIRKIERTRFFEFLLKKITIRNMLNLCLSKGTHFLENSGKFNEKDSFYGHFNV